MKKSTKRILSFLAAMAMALSLTACTGDGDAGSTQTGEVPDGKIYAEGTELNMVLSSHVSWPYNENWKIWEYIEEATGAKLNITAIPDESLATKLPLIMATPKELPDLIHLYMKEHVDDYALSGAFLSIDDNIEKLPNYTAFLDSLDPGEAAELVKQRTSGDGKVYSPPSYGTQRMSGMRTWLYRKDVFEKHDLKVPETYDELYETAKKLKKLYPESYPICFRAGLYRFEDLTPAWKNDFNYMLYYDHDIKEWKIGVQDPVMKDIVEYFRMLAAEGLVPPDYTTIETKSWEELMSTDRGFITFDYIVRIDFFNSANREENPEYTIDQMKPPVPDVPTGQSKIAKTNLNFHGWLACNTGKEQAQENAFKFIDWMYTDEATELLSWGKEGETYEVVDGKKRFILDEGEQVQTKYGLSSTGTYQRIDQDAFESTYSEENVKACIEALQYVEEQSNPTMWLALNDDEKESAARIFDDLKAYVDEELSKFLLGQKPMSEWDTFQKGIVDMGAAELIEIYAGAYDRING